MSEDSRGYITGQSELQYFCTGALSNRPEEPRFIMNTMMLQELCNIKKSSGFLFRPSLITVRQAKGKDRQAT